MRWIFIGILLVAGLQGQSQQYAFSRISADDGLSNNQVQCVLKDSRGFVWMGTNSGLNRYDGYNFRVYRNIPGDTTSLLDNRVSYIYEDLKGKLWVGNGGTLSVYDPSRDNFSRTPRFPAYPGLYIDSLSNVLQDNHGDIWLISDKEGLFRYLSGSDSILNIRHIPGDTTTISSHEVGSVVHDRDGFIWLINNSGVLEKLDPKTHRVVFRSDFLQKKYGEWMDMRMLPDTDGDLWLFTHSKAIGAFLYDPHDDSYMHFHTTDGDYRLNNNIVTDIVEDEGGQIWIGTDHGGINIVDKKDYSIRLLQHNPDNERSLSQNSIISLYKDNEGVIWVGTYKKGACYYHENLFKFRLYRHETNNPESLPYDDVNGFQEDESGNLWIATNGGGLCFWDRENEKFFRFRHDPNDPGSLSNDIIVSMLYDSRGRLWLGTYYGGLNLYDGERFRHFRHIMGKEESLSDDRVWHLFEDSRGNIWIGTLGAGLDLLNKDGQSFTHFRAFEENSIMSNYISHITEDRKGNIWIGTANGVDIYHRETGKFSHLAHDVSDTNSLSSNIISYIFIDSRNLIWIGTYSGLNLYDPSKESFMRFYKEDGLPENAILGITEDNSGNIWLSTTNGISRLSMINRVDGSLSEYRFMNFTESDGLQGKEFNDGVVYKTSKGEILFGGADGFNIFIPERLSYNTNPPQVRITGLEVFNEEIGVGEKLNGRVLLTKSISSTGQVVFRHHEDVISFEFTALNFIHPEKNEFRYMLEGFNKDWLNATSRERKATYTNLDPGEYVFRVMASNNDGVWSREEATISVIVRPPVWKTKAAIVLYVFILFGSLVFFRRLVLLRERIKFRHEQDKLESQRRHELDLLKIRFFTNVSHEFRTPLSLILSPLERILKSDGESKSSDQLKLVYRNARRLLNLVNQLLDFRRMEVQKISLKPAYGNLVEFSGEVYKCFTDLADKKSIDFRFVCNHREFMTWFDHDKVEKILFNLLSNAFKFTPEGGKISLELDIFEKEKSGALDQEGEFRFRVKDSGIGISEENQERIFERFFHKDDPASVFAQGSGIGLSLTHEFVNLYQGKISVESTEGGGSTFLVSLPLLAPPAEQESSQTIQSHEVNEDLVLESASQESVPDSKKATVLLVEDNDDFRFYLKDNLKDKFRIIEAPDGAAGLREAVKELPDLIVSDVMMPHMDGIELCRQLKVNPKTSHIPVILLTARMSEEKRKEGFETGADDYITKPFSFEILESRMNNLIRQRDLMKESFQKHFTIAPGEIGITSLDEKLMQKALSTVEAHMGDPEFSVEKLSRELGMSRVHLYKKLTALTGKTPIEFIRIMRLKRAAQYLEKSQLTIAEVAFEVGFNDPRYFSRYFKAEYGMLPSQYVQKHQKSGN